MSLFQFRYEIFFKSLTALGQYNLYYFWTNYAGDFNITLEDVKAEGKGILEVSTNGTVQVTFKPITSPIGQPYSRQAAFRLTRQTLGPRSGLQDFC